MNVPFNINDYVRVKLTPHGRKLHWEEYNRVFGNLNTFVYDPPKEDSDGWSEWQLWQLMQIFGSHCGMGFEPPFETTIEFKTK